MVISKEGQLIWKRLKMGQMMKKVHMSYIDRQIGLGHIFGFKVFQIILFCQSIYRILISHIFEWVKTVIYFNSAQQNELAFLYSMMIMPKIVQQSSLLLTISKQLIMITFINFFIIFFTQISPTLSIFCSVTCTPNQCTNNLPNGCTQCQEPFTLSNNYCVLPTQSSFSIVATKTNIAISSGASIYCGTYQFTGDYSWDEQISITYPNAITDDHFKVILYFGVIMYDQWVEGTDQIYVELSGDLQTYQINSSTVSTKSQQCYQSGLQWYSKVRVQFPHFDQTTGLNFKVSSNNQNQHNWALRQNILLLIQKCHVACVVCNDGTNTSCLECSVGYKQSGTVCDLECQEGYGQTQNASFCIECDVKCQLCYEQFDNCSACRAGAYLYQNQCRQQCPVNFFEYEANRSCLLCSAYCVQGQIESEHITQLIVKTKICFTDSVNFTYFPYENFIETDFNDTTITLDQFSTQFSVIDEQCFELGIENTNKLQFEMVQLTFSIVQEPALGYYSESGFKLSPNIYQLSSSIVWTYTIEQNDNTTNNTFENDKTRNNSISNLDDQEDPSNQTTVQTSDTSSSTILSLKNTNSILNKVLSEKWVQQIKKSGIFCYLMPGIQFSSTLLFHNDKPPQNMYEAYRFWSSFVFLQVPEWQQSREADIYVFSQLIPDIIASHSRLLQESDQRDSWRFNRTGYSAYFILDTYIPCIMIGLSWVLILVGRCFLEKLTLNTKSILATIFHKLHELAMFYIILNAVLEFMVFNHQNQLKYPSLFVGILLLLYLLIYHLYIYYNLIPYNSVDVCSYKFVEYIQNYSYFLRDVKFEETHNPYQENSYIQQWRIQHLWRPYNYQLFTIFRLVMILIALPLFQNYLHVPIICITTIQTLQLIRFIIIRPYLARWRNIFKGLIEIQLFLIFMIMLITSKLEGDSGSKEGLDWAGFGLVFSYNASYIAYFIIDLIVGFIYTNKERVEYSRIQYFREIFEKKCLLSDSTPSNKQLRNIILKGNLLQIDITKKYRVENILIEELKMEKSSRKSYNVEYHKMEELFLDMKPSIYKKNNVHAMKQSQKAIELSNHFSPYYFKIVENFFNQHAHNDQECRIILETYFKVDQNLHEPGSQIELSKSNMYQEVVVIKPANIKKYRLEKLIEGFPIPLQYLQST